jgi:hypothetical protein
VGFDAHLGQRLEEDDDLTLEASGVPCGIALAASSATGDREVAAIDRCAGFLHWFLRSCVSAGEKAQRRRREHRKNHSVPGQRVWVAAHSWGSDPAPQMDASAHRIRRP